MFSPSSSPARSVLLFAFEPFGGATMNGSAEAARQLAAEDANTQAVLLPVVRGDAETAAFAALDALPAPPSLILILGEARISHVQIEKVALNWDDFRIADNAGDTTRDSPVVEGCPAAYFSPLPVAQIVRDLEGRTPVRVRLSLSAGSFLCNHVYYHLLNRPAPCPTVFVHVPAFRAGSAEPIVQTVRAIRDAALQSLPTTPLPERASGR